MKIKVSMLSSSLHDSNVFTSKNLSFIKEIEKELGYEILVTDLKDNDCDLKLLFIASGGSEGIFLKNKHLLKEPYYLLTSGDNNSLAASLEILTYINNSGLSGEVIHGSTSYIVDRIKSLVKQNKKELPRLGVIGKPSDWLIASIPSYAKIKELYDVELVDINMDEIINKYNSILGGLESEDKKAEKFYFALKDIVDKYHLVGLTIRCFDLLDSIKMTGCLALAKLNSDGIIGTCEGDIMALITMWLVKKWFNKPSFQANPSRIDSNSGMAIFAHCTCPFSMLKEYKLTTHFESGIGIAIKGKLSLSDVTIFRLSSNLKDYSVYEGKIISNLSEINLCRTQIQVCFDNSNDLREILIHPCGNHQIIFYGRHKEKIIENINNIFNK